MTGFRACNIALLCSFVVSACSTQPGGRGSPLARAKEALSGDAGVAPPGQIAATPCPPNEFNNDPYDTCDWLGEGANAIAASSEFTVVGPDNAESQGTIQVFEFAQTFQVNTPSALPGSVGLTVKLLTNTSSQSTDNAMVVNLVGPLTTPVVGGLNNGQAPPISQGSTCDTENFNSTGNPPNIGNAPLLATGRFNTAELSYGEDTPIQINFSFSTSTPNINMEPGSEYAMIFYMESPGINHVGLAANAPDTSKFYCTLCPSSGIDPVTSQSCICDVGDTQENGVACSGLPIRPSGDAYDCTYPIGWSWIRQEREATEGCVTNGTWVPQSTADLSFYTTVNDGCTAGAYRQCGVGSCFRTIPECDSFGNFNLCHSDYCTTAADCVKNWDTSTCNNDIANSDNTTTGCISSGAACNNPSGQPYAGTCANVAETCDGYDNDCNGYTDEGLGYTTCGVGGCTTSVYNCVLQPTGNSSPPAGCYWPSEIQQPYGCPTSVNYGVPSTCTNYEAAPSAEVCNGIDDNCNGITDEGLTDTAACGYGPCQRVAYACSLQDTTNEINGACIPGDDAGTAPGADQPPEVYYCIYSANQYGKQVGTGDPFTCTADMSKSSTEICNGVDDDCDGYTDNAMTGTAPSSAPNNNTGKLSQYWYPDDTVGKPSGPPAAYNPSNPATYLGDCHYGLEYCNYSESPSSPNFPWDPTTTPALAPVTPIAEVSFNGQTDVWTWLCDNQDNDCDGYTDNWPQNQPNAMTRQVFPINQTWPDDISMTNQPCNGPGVCCDWSINAQGFLGGATSCVGQCQLGTDSCNFGNTLGDEDTTNWHVVSAAVLPSAEVCNGLDDNCNGETDEGLGSQVCGNGVCAVTVPTCEIADGGGYVTLTDCKAGSFTNLGNTAAASTEVCNGLDDDCDGWTDNNPPLSGPNYDMTQSCHYLCDAYNLDAGTTICRYPNGNNQGQCSSGQLACLGTNGWAQASACSKPGLNQAGGTDGGLTMVQEKGPSHEVCNGLDDDCDGYVDNVANTNTPITQACNFECQGWTGTGKNTCIPTKGQCRNGAQACGDVYSDYGTAPSAPTVQTVASNQGTPQWLAADSSGNVYWTSYSTGNVVEWSGGTPVTFATGQSSPGTITTDSTGNVYFTEQTASGYVVKYNGSSLTTLSSNDANPSGIAVGPSGSIYWADLGSGKIVKRTGGSNTPIATGQGSPVSVAVDSDENVYWVTQGGALVEYTPAHLGASTVTTLVTGDNNPAAVVTDVDNVPNWVDNATPGFLNQFVNGAEKTLEVGQSAPNSLAVDQDRNVYWTNSGNGTVVEYEYSASTTTTLATGQSSPSGIIYVRSANSIYWGDTGDGTIKSLSVVVPMTWGLCASEVGPSVETCNDLDDDCDGFTDNAVGSSSSNTLQQTCDALCASTAGCQYNVGQCQNGYQTCGFGNWGSCPTSGANKEIGPTGETCNNEDDNCDGYTDNESGVLTNNTLLEGCSPLCNTWNSFPTTHPLDPDTCTSGVGQCVGGSATCTSGNWGVCNNPADIGPSYEVCNNEDDDCDGYTDNKPGSLVSNTLLQVCDLACQSWDNATPTKADQCQEDVGQCKHGSQTCSTGSWLNACPGETGPTSEVCNDLDDDCDSSTDNKPGEGNNTLTQSCSLACNSYPGCQPTVGVCKDGIQGCTFGTWGGTCAGEVAPSTDICNDLDDNCDGYTDNAPGDLTSNTLLETCDSLCNSWNDNASESARIYPSCPGGVAYDTINGTPVCPDYAVTSMYDPATCSPNTGRCANGSSTCSFGTWESCATSGAHAEIGPSAEICNGLDDDCNGQTDEGLGYTTCGLGICQTTVYSCCMPGDTTCQASESVGQPVTASTQIGGTNQGNVTGVCKNYLLPKLNCTGNPNCDSTGELCNGIDDNCNGYTDEGFPPITCGLGICQTSVPGCTNAGQSNAFLTTASSCTAQETVQPVGETCNDLDDNCDGFTDNAILGQPGYGSSLANNTLETTCDALCMTWNAAGHSGATNGDTCVSGTGQCHNGSETCTFGNWGACPTSGTNAETGPSAEQCNDVDDDCDTYTDNVAGTHSNNTITESIDPLCLAWVASATSNACLNKGQCSSATDTCTFGTWGTTTAEVGPSTEQCNNRDDDCDGFTDNKVGSSSNNTLLDTVTCDPLCAAWNNVLGAIDQSDIATAGSGAITATTIGEVFRAGTTGYLTAISVNNLKAPSTLTATLTISLNGNPSGTTVDNNPDPIYSVSGLSITSASTAWSFPLANGVPITSGTYYVWTLTFSASTAFTTTNYDSSHSYTNGLAFCYSSGTTACTSPTGSYNWDFTTTVAANAGYHDTCTDGHGICSAGTQVCNGGGGTWGSCASGSPAEVGPANESCNGADDDCDGFTDNQPGVNTSYTLVQECDSACAAWTIPGHAANCIANTGQCHDGQETCASSGWGSCATSGTFAEVGPSTEQCNALDDDCDGVTDNIEGQNTGIAEPSGCDPKCAAWNVNGTGGASIETGDATSHGLTGDTYTCTPNTGICSNGLANCCNPYEVSQGRCTSSGYGNWETCGATGTNETGPTYESCNGLDDDCDGKIDDWIAYFAGCTATTGASGCMCPVTNGSVNPTAQCNLSGLTQAHVATAATGDATCANVTNGCRVGAGNDSGGSANGGTGGCANYYYDLDGNFCNGCEAYDGTYATYPAAEASACSSGYTYATIPAGPTVTTDTASGTIVNWKGFTNGTSSEDGHNYYNLVITSDEWGTYAQYWGNLNIKITSGLGNGLSNSGAKYVFRVFSSSCGGPTPGGNSTGWNNSGTTVWKNNNSADENYPVAANTTTPAAVGSGSTTCSSGGYITNFDLVDNAGGGAVPINTTTTSNYYRTHADWCPTGDGSPGACTTTNLSQQIWIDVFEIATNAGACTTANQGCDTGGLQGTPSNEDYTLTITKS